MDEHNNNDNNNTDNNNDDNDDDDDNNNNDNNDNDNNIILVGINLICVCYVKRIPRERNYNVLLNIQVYMITRS